MADALTLLTYSTIFAHYPTTFLPTTLFMTGAFKNTNFSDFTGINALARNFYLLPDGRSAKKKPNNDREIALGVWHILPNSTSEQLIAEDKTSPKDMVRSLKEGNESVFLAFHGRRGNRAANGLSGVINFYNTLSNMNYHTLAIDYRGFGDSTGEATEAGIIADCFSIYRYVRKLAPQKKIVIFGQSLGASISTEFARALSLEKDPLTALILMAAFSSAHDELFYLLTNTTNTDNQLFFDLTLKEALKASRLNFDSVAFIKDVKCPILLVSNTIDPQVPNSLSRMIRDSALAANRNLTYVEVTDPTVGHNVHWSPLVIPIVKNFLGIEN